MGGVSRQLWVELQDVMKDGNGKSKSLAGTLWALIIDLDTSKGIDS